MTRDELQSDIAIAMFDAAIIKSQASLDGTISYDFVSERIDTITRVLGECATELNG